MASNMKTTVVTTSILLLFLWTSLASNHGEDQCYCLTKNLVGLRGALHVEAVNIDGENVYLIAEQVGVIQKYTPNAPTPLSIYINISGLIEFDPGKVFEQNGLLGFAPHPNFSSNKMLYLYSTRRVNGRLYVVISEIMGTAVNGEKMLVLIELHGDARRGGQLLFGLDGYLYAFIGDGGNDTSTVSVSQEGSELLGKVLRLDVDKLTVGDFKLQYYDIPQNNPQYAGWRPEIYAAGFRNPWRCSIDKGDSRGRIFCGDLGTNVADEINVILNGGNYGYPLKEGTVCVVNETLCENIENEVPPVVSFNRSAGPISAVIGGPLYRGSDFPNLEGQLIIGDYISGLIYAIQETVAADNSSQFTMHNFTECAPSLCGCESESPRRQYLLSFGTTFSGEMLLMMTDSLTPGDADTSILTVRKPPSSTPTCGSSRLNLNTLLGLVLVMFSIMNYLGRI